MAPCAPLPLPPPAPLTAFLEGDGTVHPSNGNDCPRNGVPPVMVSQPKLPSKSSLKRHSMFGTTHHLILQSAPIRHTRSLSGQNEYGLTISNMMMDKEASAGEKQPRKSGTLVGDGLDVVVSTEDYIQYKRNDSRVTWTDNHGKNLAEVWEFEPRIDGGETLRELNAVYSGGLKESLHSLMSKIYFTHRSYPLVRVPTAADIVRRQGLLENSSEGII